MFEPGENPVAATPPRFFPDKISSEEAFQILVTFEGSEILAPALGTCACISFFSSDLARPFREFLEVRGSCRAANVKLSRSRR